VKARILSLDSAEHRAAQELMPWFVNGTLDPGEASAVARHIAECARCQKDAAEQEGLRSIAVPGAGGGDVDRDWAVLRSRIGALPRSAKPAPEFAKPRWWKQWLPIAVVVQAAVMLSLLLVLVGAPLRDERYRALGSATAAAEPNAVAVFRDDATNQEMRDALHAAGARIVGGPPVFLKVAPDLGEGEPDQIVRVAMQHNVDAIIVANTTISRPPLKSRFANEGGGLSGDPLKALALGALHRFRSASGGAIPLIAAGGIASADHAWDRIRAGASLVQLYSAMVYEGPGIARRIAHGLAERLKRHGFSSISDAVGSEAIASPAV
jgi:nucleotide-binding universal stress UspA family protein